MSGRATFLSVFLALLFVFTSTSPLHFHHFTPETTETQSTSGRSVHYGTWVAHREMPIDAGCEGSYYGPDKLLIDSSTEGIIAVYTSNCYSGDISDVFIYDVIDFSQIISLQIEYEPKILQFSPDGGYLALASFENVKIYETSNWEVLLDEEMSNFLISDATWSGDSNRLVVATGNNGGHMYEGPEWNEVDGTTSNGNLVAHHPTEDKIWYINSDGSGNVYEYQSVPLAGYQWVMTRSFTAANGNHMITSPDGNSLVIYDDSYTNIYSTSDYLQEEGFSMTNPSFSFDGTTMLLNNNNYYDAQIVLYSTNNWSPEKEIFVESTNGNNAFSYNDSEIFLLAHGDYSTKLTGYMPDSDQDGVADYRDECPGTDTLEESNSAGCAPSQRDSDSDGVNDLNDLCPRTKPDVSVDGKGCSVAQLTDSDGDGISDSDDQCPNSSEGSISDRRGCSSIQRDVDGDGIVDDLDQCPLFTDNDCPRVVFWNTTFADVENTSEYRDIEFSPDGSYIAAWSIATWSTYNLHILSPEFDSIFTFQGDYFKFISDFQWDPSSNSLIVFWTDSWSSGCTYQIWDADSQVLSEEFDAYEGCTQINRGTTRFSPDGTTFAFTGFSWMDYRTTTIIKNFSTHSTLLYDSDFSVDYLEFSTDGGSLIGGDGDQFIMWDTTEYEFIKSSRATNTRMFYLTPDGNYILTTNDQTLKFYKTSDLEQSRTVNLTENKSEIVDISFSRSGDLMYATVMVGYCSWGCEEGEGALTKLHSYDIDGNELVLLRSSEIFSTQNILSPVYHPLEERVYVKPTTSGNYTEWMPDSDGDGFIDSVDECPGTSLDVEVDERGCGGDQLDDDGDGLANFEDLCPDSPEGIDTDESGCTDQQVDEDFDGICNPDAQSNGPSNCVGRDQCPGSASGIIIDSNGCSWAQQDNDGDGIINVDDLCEDTEIASDADENGCDRKQRDSDADSINDYWDDCEGTPNGDIIDDVGCSDIQVDSDLDSICNRDAVSPGPSNCTLVDRCPNTGMNETIDENGCSWNQRDDDGDGIFNKFDQCPETMADSVSPNGCSAWQVDTDGDGVYDANDECANTNADQIANSKGCSSLQNDVVETSSESDILNSTVLVQATGLVCVLLVVFLLLRRRSSSVNPTVSEIEYPPYATRGGMREGQEWIEYPEGSQQWFYRDPSTQQWVHRK